MPTFRFKDLWITTAIQQREEHHGPIEDSAVLTTLLAESAHQNNLDAKVIRRAYLLAQRDGLLSTIQQWTQASKLALWVLTFFAIITGVGLAFSALDNQQKHVNILLALVALLGLHGLTFLLWLFSFLASWQQQSLLGKCWLWLSRKIARTTDALLAMQAFIQTSNQQGGMRWIVSTISHGFWLIALCTATITWLALLAGKQFSFGWETTILSADSFVALTHSIGLLPALLGFPMPTTEIIVQSSNHIALAPEAQRIWSVWLTGQLVIWGVLLRLICFLVSFFKAKTALASTKINRQSPSYQAVINRLTTYEHLQTDTIKPDYILPKVTDNTNNIKATSSSLCIIGVDLPPNIRLPNLLPSNVTRIESREERHQLLKALSQNPVQQLLMLCDSTQTPDRGIAYFIHDISQYAQQSAVYLLNHNEANSRLSLWQKSLSEMGILDKQIWYHPQQLMTWLQPHTNTVQ